MANYIRFKIRPKPGADEESFAIYSAVDFKNKEGHLCAQSTLHKINELIIKSENSIMITKGEPEDFEDELYTIYLSS